MILGLAIRSMGLDRTPRTRRMNERSPMAITPPTVGHATVNGSELAYQIHGSGRPLVLLHGAFGSADMFGANVATLAAGRQVIGVDLQSHGRTPAAERPMRFETMAADIAALVGHLGFERAAIM